MKITIRNQNAVVTCQTHGAELLSYQTTAGKEYLWQKDPAYWAKTSPVLFPYIGPVPETVTIHGTAYKIPRHGFIKDAEFEVREQGADYVVLTAQANDFTLSVYPYSFTFTVTFRLQESALEVTYGVRNQGAEEMPFLVGGHPGFFCPMEAGERFNDYLLHFADEAIPDFPLTYSKFDNDAILFENLKCRSVKLIHYETERGLQFDFPDYPSIAFWTPVKKNAPFLCLEPWCGGTMDQVLVTNLLEKKYVQHLPGGESRDYRFSFRPC